jgi:hypothetical protein
MTSTHRTGRLRVAHLVIVACGVVWLATRFALAQDAPLRPKADAATEADRSRLLGLLLRTTVSVDFDETPAREAFKSLSQQTRIPIKPRWCDDAVGFGLDPESPVSLSVTDQPTLDVLESMLSQCVGKGLTGNEECTWQLRRGFVEIGTKERLSVPTARDMRIYELRDMMLDAPWFSSDDNLRVRLFRDQNNPQNAGQRARKDDKGSFRKSPQHMAVEVIAEICDTIEPGRWDYGQEDARPTDDRLVPLPEGVDPNAGAPAAPATGPTPPAPAGKAASPAVSPLPPRSQTGVPRWASVRLWGDRLIVVAPDFIHRQIGGYPTPAPPEGADLETGHQDQGAQEED